MPVQNLVHEVALSAPVQIPQILDRRRGKHQTRNVESKTRARQRGEVALERGFALGFGTKRTQPASPDEGDCRL